MHPAYKLEYFRAACWEAEWIQVAEGLIQTEFDQNYASLLMKDNSENVNKVDASLEVEKDESVRDSSVHYTLY